MKSIISLFVLAASLLSIPALAGAKDNLVAFHGPEPFCNIERLAALPEPERVCGVIVQLKLPENNFTQVNNNEFGNLIWLQVFYDQKVMQFYTEMTLQQLLNIRYDDRIDILVPDAPMGPTGSFTVRNGNVRKDLLVPDAHITPDSSFDVLSSRKTTLCK